jgi:exopolysaccharide production protein ExoQ
MPMLSDAGKSHSPGEGLSGTTLLAAMPAVAIFYVLLILPFLPDDGKGRIENIMFWPLMAMLTLMLFLRDRAQADYGFFRSVPIASMIAYLVFSAASVTWAYSPDLAFSRLIVQALALIVIILPNAMRGRARSAIAGVYPCLVIAIAVSAVFVLTTPPSPIGHPGYFTHKQELGLLAAVGIITSGYELLQGGWRRIVALVTMAVAFWLVFESESKSALAFAGFALIGSWGILLVCRITRLTPAIILGTVVIASMFVSNPIERLGYRMYGDASLTGRTGIWAFIDYQISHRPWFGWGFHSYYFVPNSPHIHAPGYVREMPSSHSGYMELKLETGRIGYWIFLISIFASLHLLERVRRIDPVRAWFFLSFQLFAILINLTDSGWFILSALWMLYALVVAEAVRISLSSKVLSPANRSHRRPTTVATSKLGRGTP